MQQKYNTTKTRDTVVMGLILWHRTRTRDTRDRDTTVLPKPVLCPTRDNKTWGWYALARDYEQQAEMENDERGWQTSITSDAHGVIPAVVVVSLLVHSYKYDWANPDEINLFSAYLSFWALNWTFWTLNYSLNIP